MARTPRAREKFQRDEQRLGAVIWCKYGKTGWFYIHYSPEVSVSNSEIVPEAAETTNLQVSSKENRDEASANRHITINISHHLWHELHSWEELQARNSKETSNTGWFYMHKDAHLQYRQEYSEYPFLGDRERNVRNLLHQVIKKTPQTDHDRYCPVRLNI